MTHFGNGKRRKINKLRGKNLIVQKIDENLPKFIDCHRKVNLLTFSEKKNHLLI